MKLKQLTREDVVQHMLEIALYICNLDDNSDSLELEFNGLK